jgi:hypothetical protein
VDQANRDFNEGYYGTKSKELAEMSDDALAAWQAGWKERTADDILAEREWQRRMLAHEFGLNRRIANLNAKWAIVVAIVGVCGTLAGAWLGATLQAAPATATHVQQSAIHADTAAQVSSTR